MAGGRVIAAPVDQPTNARPASATEASAMRVRPRSVSAHTTMLIATSRASSAPAPSTPLCCPSTHTSQATVANMGKAIRRRKVSIQAPGRGSQ